MVAKHERRCGAPPAATRSAPRTPRTPSSGRSRSSCQSAPRRGARTGPLDADRDQARGAGDPPRAASASWAPRRDRRRAEETVDWVALIPAAGAGPAERAERREAIARSREALKTLKPAELRALTLLAEGYSYAEIGEMTGCSQNKVNRCLAEGRERFRAFLTRSESGGRCAELRPLLSAFCDGEASAEDAATLREHLRACAHCRARCAPTGRRPRAVAALAPVPLAARSLLERAHEPFARPAVAAAGPRRRPPNPPSRRSPPPAERAAPAWRGSPSCWRSAPGPRAAPRPASAPGSSRRRSS